jgi:hypothetical protein
MATEDPIDGGKVVWFRITMEGKDFHSVGKNWDEVRNNMLLNMVRHYAGSSHMNWRQVR